MTWREQARDVLFSVMRGAIADRVDRKELLRRINESYPFGPRSHYPYKVWREEVRNVLYDGQGTPVKDRGRQAPSEARKLYADGQVDLFSVHD
jgi:hypothetical protein